MDFLLSMNLNKRKSMYLQILGLVFAKTIASTFNPLTMPISNRAHLISKYRPSLYWLYEIHLHIAYIIPINTSTNFMSLCD